MNIELTNLRYQNVSGFNCNGLFAQIDWDSPASIRRATTLINGVRPKVMRVFDGGGFRYVHMLYDENGNRSIGYGYRRGEIESAFEAGELDQEAYQSYLGKIIKQESITHSYLDMMIHLYKSLDYKPVVLYVANVLNETPQVEAATVKYLIDNGVNVVGVELGNEMYGKMSFEQYRLLCDPFIEAIRELNPGIMVSMPMGPTTYTQRHAEWNNDLHRAINAGLDIDAIVPHIYYNVEKENLESLYFDEYTSLNPDFPVGKNTAPMGSFKALIAGLINDIDILFGNEIREAERIASGKKIWITEWGTTPSSPFSNSFTDAVAIAIAMNEILNHDLVDFACYQSLLAGDFHAAITPIKKLDPETLNDWLAPRSKWFMFSHLNDVFYHTMSDVIYEGEEGGVLVLPFYMEQGEEGKDLELIIINTTDKTFNLMNPDVYLGGERYNCALRFKRSSVFGAPHFGNGHSDVYSDNNYYSKENRVQNNVIVQSYDSVHEDLSPSAPPYSITSLGMNLVKPDESTEDPCKGKYDEGFRDGYTQGYKEGEEQGYADGQADRQNLTARLIQKLRLIFS